MLIAVWVCIHTDSVQSCKLNPPYTILYEVVSKEWVTLIQIGHVTIEPAIGHKAAIGNGSVGVKGSWDAVVCTFVIGVNVKPALHGYILHPPVLTSAMVENHVLNHLKTLCMSLSIKSL